MSIVEARRKATEAVINLNPATIVLKRKARIPDGAGGWKDGEIELPPQTVRLFISSLRGTRETTSEGGQVAFQTLGLLARHDADIQRKDRFEYQGRSFTVTGFTPVSLGGEVVSIQAELEEVV